MVAHNTTAVRSSSNVTLYHSTHTNTERTHSDQNQMFQHTVSSQSGIYLP